MSDNKVTVVENFIKIVCSSRNFYQLIKGNLAIGLFIRAKINCKHSYKWLHDEVVCDRNYRKLTYLSKSLVQTHSLRFILASACFY